MGVAYSVQREGSPRGGFTAETAKSAKASLQRVRLKRTFAVSAISAVNLSCSSEPEEIAGFHEELPAGRRQAAVGAEQAIAERRVAAAVLVAVVVPHLSRRPWVVQIGHQQVRRETCF